MRRWFQLVLLSGYMLGPWAVAGAQTRVFMDVTRAIAITSCVKDGDSTRVVSVMNMAALDSPNLQEYVAHEAEHRRQFAADSTLCPELMRLTTLIAEDSPKAPKALGAWVPKLLKLEVGAYCVSAQVPIERGDMPEAVYLVDQEMLLEQFRDWLPREAVMAAWFAACGQLIGGPPNGQGK